MKRPSLVQVQSCLPHGIGLGLIIILLLAAQGFIAGHPALAAVLVFAFSVPYIAAAVRSRKAYYLYGGMLLGAASYFMACNALGAPVAWFPPLSLPLVAALWLVGLAIRKKADPNFASFAATTFRAMNITICAFAFQAMWQLPQLLNPSGTLGAIAAATLFGYAALYLLHGLAFQSRLYGPIFAMFATVALAAAGNAFMGREFMLFALEAAALVVLLAATAAHRRAGLYLSRWYYLGFAAVSALAIAAIMIERRLGLYAPSLTAASCVAGYLLLVRVVGDPRRATSSERLVARLLIVSAAACAAAVAPFVLIPDLEPLWVGPALITGAAFAWLAYRRRADTQNHRNLSVYGAALFLTASFAAMGAAFSSGAHATAIVALGCAGLILVLHRLAAAPHLRTTELALAEALGAPMFLAWFFPLLSENATTAIAAALVGFHILLAAAVLRRRAVLLCGTGPALAGAWLAVAPVAAAAAWLPAWAVLAGAAAISGLIFGAGIKRYSHPARVSIGLFWLIAGGVGIFLSYKLAGPVPAVYASTVVAAGALVVAGLLRRAATGATWFTAAAWLLAGLGTSALTAFGLSGDLPMPTVALGFFGLAAAGTLGWLIGRGIWAGRAGFAAFAVAGLLFAFHRTPDLALFSLVAAAVPAVLFFTAAVLRKLHAALAPSALGIAHAASAAVAVILLASAHSEPVTPLLAASLAAYTALYMAGAAGWRSNACLLGAGAWLSGLILFGFATSQGLRYADNAMLAAALAALWLAVAYALQHKNLKRLAVPPFVLSTCLAGAAALLISIEPHADHTWQVFLVSGLVMAALAFLLRQDIHIYLVMLVMAMMVYDWVRASTSHFTQDVLFYPVVAVAVLSVFLLLPVLKKTANRFAALPVFGIFSIWGVAFVMLPVLGAAAFMMSAYSLKVTAHPRFCTSCHYMDQYYDSWQHSSHKSVACIECHYEPGIKNEIAGKGEGMIQLIKYLSHSYTNRPHGIVSNASCMRAGCHETIADSGETLLFNGRIRFRHDKHLKNHPRGQDLNCVSCHGQMVQGTHIGVTQTTCLTCHFYKRGDKPVAAGDCLSCHSVLDETVKIGNETFDHPAFLADKAGVECSHCHSQVTQGTGEISTSRCRSCHLEDYGPVEDPEAFHLIHVRKKHFDCLQCHDEIRHGIRPMDQQVHVSATNCNSCHGGERHTIQQRIYAGTAVTGLEQTPDFMYVAGVTCDGCHTDLHLLSVGEMTLTGKQSTAKQCSDCHDDASYADMLTDWQAEVRSRLAQLQEDYSRLAAICGAPREDAASEDQARDAWQTLEQAKIKLDLVVLDGSAGAHNYFYITSILDSAAEDLDACDRMAAQLTSPQPAGPEPTAAAQAPGSHTQESSQ